LGCLLYELTEFKNPFYSDNLNYYTLGNKIKCCEYEPISRNNISITLKSLIQCIIVNNPNQRPDIQTVLTVAQYAYNALQAKKEIPKWGVREIQQLLKYAKQQNNPITISSNNNSSTNNSMNMNNSSINMNNNSINMNNNNFNTNSNGNINKNNNNSNNSSQFGMTDDGF
jgi:hypothetical protein